MRGLCVVLAVALFASVAQAQEAKKGKGKARKASVANMFKAPAGVTFTEEQKTKVAEIQKQFESRIVEARAKAALSKEQQAARKEAVAKAKSEGKKPREANAAGDGAASLTEEQKQAQQDLKSIRKEIEIAIVGILTDDQKNAAGAERRKNREKRKAEKQ
jgi:hypothetical protein